MPLTIKSVILPLRGVRYGLCVPKIFVSVFFLRPMTCVTRDIRFSIRKRLTCWLCHERFMLVVSRMNREFIQHMRKNLLQVEWSKFQQNISIGGHLGTEVN